MDFEKELKVERTNIPGLIVFDLPVHGDNRGWFKENWQRAKMTALGLPDFGPVQNNISFNAKKGVTRGIHAEPWDKYISIATGAVFGAWVDLRPGESFGQVCDLRAAWRGQQLPGARGRHRVHVPRQRVLKPRAEEDVHLREPRGPGPAHRLADPTGGVRAQRGRPAPHDAQGRQAHGPAPHDGHRLQRPARPRHPRLRGGARPGGLRVQRHRHVRLLRPGPVRPPDLHPRHGQGDLPPARLRGAVRHVRPDRFGRGEELGGHRPRGVLDQTNGNGDKVRPISTEEYFANAKAPVSPRPTHSALSIAKIENAGYHAPDWEETLKAYVAKELGK